MNLTQFRGLDTLVLSGGRRDWKCLKKQRFRCSQLDLWSPRHDIPDDFNEPLVESLSMLSLYETNESFQAPPVQEEPNCQFHKLTVTVNDPVTPWASDPASFTKYLDIKFVVSCRLAAPKMSGHLATRILHFGKHRSPKERESHTQEPWSKTKKESNSL